MLELSNERDPEPVAAMTPLSCCRFVNLHPPWGAFTETQCCNNLCLTSVLAISLLS